LNTKIIKLKRFNFSTYHIKEAKIFLTVTNLKMTTFKQQINITSEKNFEPKKSKRELLL